jgi:hypothetical protein
MTMTGFNHSVTWREFRTVRSRQGRVAEDAFIKARKWVTYDYSGSRGNYRVTGVRAGIVVNRSRSWVVRGAQTAELLRHEQGHFDITALGMREEANRIGALTGRNGRDLTRQANTIRREINRKIASANRRYDARTNHSANTAAQRTWLASIRRAKSRADGTIDSLPG